MWNKKTPYRSFNDYEYEKALQNKRNLAEVESVLTLYQKNNKNLFDQVEELIRQNEVLKRQVNDSYISKVKSSSPIMKSTQTDLSNIKQTMTKSTAKKSNKQQFSKSGYHPRNAYLTPQQIINLNVSNYKKARNLHKEYDYKRNYEEFKEKLTAKKQQLKRDSKTNPMTVSRKVYLDQPSLETIQKKPLKQQNENSKPNRKEDTKRKETSPFDKFYKQLSYHSPLNEKREQTYDKSKSPLKSSVIKVEDIYPKNSVRIQQPRTKWKDIQQGQNYYYPILDFRRNQQKEKINISSQLNNTHYNKKSKKRFLNVISRSAANQEHSKKAIQNNR